MQASAHRAVDGLPILEDDTLAAHADPGAPQAGRIVGVRDQAHPGQIVTL